MNELKRRLLNLFIALDQLLWVILTLGNGCPDETISAALWRMERAGRWSWRCHIVLERESIMKFAWIENNKVKDVCLGVPSE